MTTGVQGTEPPPLPHGQAHIANLVAALPRLDTDRLDAWGRRLAQTLGSGARLLVAGNGGSAAEAQHLTSELVGRLRDERQPLSAIALHAETSTLTALSNDYSYGEVFARQVRAHGRPGDVLLLLSTSGRSGNVLRAAEAARQLGLTTWALTGPLPNPLASACDDAVAVQAASAATVQECHLVAVHLIGAAVDIALGASVGTVPAPSEPRRGAPAVSRRMATRRGPIVVIGDALLDRDLTGRVERISPEAPVPVVDGVGIQTRPGGAGLAAVLAHRANERVVLVTALSNDDEGRHLEELLRQAGVEVVDLGHAGSTPVKTRVRADGRSLLMLSSGDTGPGGTEHGLSGSERELLAQAAAVLVADYGNGVADEPSVRSALTAVAAHIPIVWDPHLRGGPPIRGARLVTPNSAEARHFAPGVAGTGLDVDIARGLALVESWGAASVGVTRGAAGAVFLQSGERTPLVIPGTRVATADSCGAGDAFAAAVTVALAAGALPSEAVTRAVATASQFVALGGASGLAATPELPARDDPLELVERVRQRGGTIVATGGCFDLIHTGHVLMLERARALGDCLVVCLNSDESVRRLKGPDRPLVRAEDRACVLRALAAVDAVVVFEEDRPTEALSRIRPDIYVKGGDYHIEDLPEAPSVASWGGQAVILPYVDGRSTTALIHEITRRRSAV